MLWERRKELSNTSGKTDQSIGDEQRRLLANVHGGHLHVVYGLGKVACRIFDSVRAISNRRPGSWAD
ncbi:hypothetical protein PRIPAC_72247 [Pristionchus pacificus]|uniref:Uncharacterized protein n=1 Tax=Pristionchus pacificus TaxID=54126 RepID=A0A2A6C8V3_PRIPA|nr:hypothetical protein PRIPAC_72247 [Pristionchus pacificus]|eukprot:PDM74536.1 hypothetical protein PRIPAC_41892 [Pristionchus pacificus]